MHIAAYMIGSAAAKGKRCFFLVHRAELLDQAVRTFRDYGIAHGVIAAGHAPNPFAPVQIASVQTLARRLDRIQPPDLVIVDEAHHVAAKTWAKVIEVLDGECAQTPHPQDTQRPTRDRARESHKNRYRRNIGSKIILVGLTATPERLDGKGLGEAFQVIVRGPDVRALIDAGWLADYDIYAPDVPDMGDIKTRMGDFDKAGAARVAGTSTITGNAIDHYRRLAAGKQAVAFCVTIAHAESVAASFNAAGIPAATLHGQLQPAHRKALIARFRDGQIKILTSVDIISEGFDLPALQAVILLRPTKSLALYLQQVGRVLRPEQGKAKALILDHVGNVLRHGLPDEARDWSLQGRKKGARKDAHAVAIRQCPSCYYVHHAAMRHCPTCGHVYYAQAVKPPEQVDGDLKKINKAQMIQARKSEQSSARTLAELEAIAQARGYKPGWAAHVMKARKAKAQHRTTP